MIYFEDIANPDLIYCITIKDKPIFPNKPNAKSKIKLKND
jgi:hypothetical protein